MTDVTAIPDRGSIRLDSTAISGQDLSRVRPGAGRPFEIAGRCYGATMSTAEAAELLCCSAERLQQERGRGTLPVEPLQLGRRLRWPTVLVAEALGLSVRGAGGAQ